MSCLRVRRAGWQLRARGSAVVRRRDDTPASLTAPVPDGTLGRDERRVGRTISQRLPSHRLRRSRRCGSCARPGATCPSTARCGRATGSSTSARIRPRGGEVTLQPVERLGVDAAIVFADILLVLEPLGIGLEFTRGEGPRIERPMRSAEDVARLRPVAVDEAVPFVFETVRLARKALGEPRAADRLRRARPSRSRPISSRAARRASSCARSASCTTSRPPGVASWTLADITAAYLHGQIAAGAQAVQLFDSWVGTLSPADYRDHVLPHSRTDSSASRRACRSSTSGPPRPDSFI